ncbi:MAG: oligosaccharide flippase family protein [Verrucomicrobia bacterium]|nr:oligosaccharide flippase family protein [Verrucomicrobiota bacterium]
MPDTTVPIDSGWRRLGTSAGWLVAGRVVSAACGLVQVPLALTSLGTERFGLWIAITALMWTLSSFDGGLGFALQNRIATLVATGTQADAAALVRRGRRWLWWLAGGVGLAGVALAICGPWSQWLGVNDAVLAAEIKPAVAIAFAAATLSLPLSLAARVAAAVQLMSLTGRWTAVASVLSLVAVAVAARLHLPLAGFVLAASIALLVAPAGTWLQLHRQITWLRRRDAPAPAVPGLGRESVWFFLPQLGAAFNGSFVPALVAFFADPATTGTYGVLQRLFGLALQLQGMVLMPTWPAYTQAAARGDPAFARRTFRATWMLTALGFILPTLLLTPWVPAVVRMWLGDRAPAIAPFLLWMLAGWHVLQYCGQPIAMLLNGVGRMESMAVLGWIGIAVTLALCPMLGLRWGAAGVIAALALPYALLNLPVTWWHACRAIAAVAPRSASVAAAPMP